MDFRKVSSLGCLSIQVQRQSTSITYQTVSENEEERNFRALGQPHTQSKPGAHGKGSTRKRGSEPLHPPREKKDAPPSSSSSPSRVVPKARGVLTRRANGAGDGHRGRGSAKKKKKNSNRSNTSAHALNGRIEERKNQTKFAPSFMGWPTSANQAPPRFSPRFRLPKPC